MARLWSIHLCSSSLSLFISIKEQVGVLSVLGTQLVGMDILTLYGLSVSHHLPPPLPPICLALPFFPASPLPSTVKGTKVTRPGVKSHAFWSSSGIHLRWHLPPLCLSFLSCKKRELN